jgi:hypothetical protein
MLESLLGKQRKSARLPECGRRIRRSVAGPETTDGNEELADDTEVEYV